ncbi:hypothetical protein C8Q76DRAFT_800399 [Earliella scabrosa]|nr:hypothetical protein C8Q76DRAFT_800399 [Earliella scabrosa]
MEYDARVLPALAALRYLRRVDFDTVSDPTIAWVGKTGWNLHTLSLDYDDPEVVNRPHIQNHRCTLPILLDTIAQFPYLHTLKVRSCRFSLSLSDIPNYDPPIFRSVQKLFLWNATPRALDLVNLFPNVSLVDFDYDPLYDQEEFQPSLGPRWPPIDSLILTSLDTVRCASQRLNTARHIQIGRDISVADPDGTDSRNIATLVDVLQKVSPVHAQLSVEVGTPPMRFWARVEAVAPRLRYLELKVSLEDLKQEYASWLDNLPDSLRPLPLLYLRLHLPQLPIIHIVWDPETGNQLLDGIGRPVFNATQSFSRELYDKRVITAQTLPKRFADAIPTLKVIALADEGPTGITKDDGDGPGSEEDEGEPAEDSGGGTGDGETEADSENGSEDSEGEDDGIYFEEQDDYEHQNGWHRKLETLQWWRVIKAGGERHIQELTKEHGNRIERFLESSKYSDKEPQIDDVLAAM